jgi:hypothetical protein
MKALLIALALARGAESASTWTAISSGASEGNPLLPKNAIANVAVVGAETAGQVWLLHVLERRHPTLARNIALVAIGVDSGLAGYNIRITLEARRH